jgi:hypothetical protein
VARLQPAAERTGPARARACSFAPSLISPGGFERFFDEIAAAWPEDREPMEDDMARIAEIGARYGLEFDFESVPALMERYGLVQ